MRLPPWVRHDTGRHPTPNTLYLDRGLQMAEESSLNDVLPLVLQGTIDKKLLGGEQVLMTLAGASGEALVVTDQRVMIVREQMGMVGATEVDCFSHAYEQ